MIKIYYCSCGGGFGMTLKSLKKLNLRDKMLNKLDI